MESKTLFIVILVSLLSATCLTAQILYTETFSGSQTGTVTGALNDAGGNWTSQLNEWESSGPDQWGEIGGSWRATDIDVESFWFTRSIDVSACEELTYSLKIGGGSSDFECTGTGADIFRVAHNVDGGGFTTTNTICDDNTIPTQTLSATVDVSTASTFTVRATFRNQANTETYFMDDVEVECIVPLPVMWGELSAERGKDGDVIINWQTLKEENTEGFWVERANPNLDDTLKVQYFPVGFVSAVGTTNNLQEYRFVDGSTPDTRLFYRLSQNDFDGTVHYSRVMEVSGTNAQLPIQAFFKNHGLSVYAPEQTQVIVFNTMGQKLVHRTTMQNGETFISLPMLPNGIYLWQLKTPSGENLNGRGYFNGRN